MPQSHSPASDSERMYACQHCPKRYARKDYLERHELNHTRPQSVCPACGKGFARPDVLRKHLSTSCKSRRGSDGDAPAPLTTAEEDALVPRKRRRPQRRLTNASPTPSSDDDYHRPSKRRTQSYETYPALERLGRMARSPHYAEAVRGLGPLSDDDSEPDHDADADNGNDSSSIYVHTPPVSASASAPLNNLPSANGPVFGATPETLSLFKADTTAPEWRTSWPGTTVEPVETVTDAPEPEGDDLFSWLFPEPERVEVDKTETSEPPYESYLHAWEHTARARPPAAGVGTATGGAAVPSGHTGVGMGILAGLRPTPVPQPAAMSAFRPDPWEDWRMAQGFGGVDAAREEVMKMFAKPPLQIPFASLTEGLRAR